MGDYMEQKKDIQNQVITITNRKRLEISSIKKIESMNEEEFVVLTNLSTVRISGENLEMLHLDLDKGNLLIGGTIDDVVYLDKEVTKEKKQGFMSKIFKWFNLEQLILYLILRSHCY